MQIIVQPGLRREKEAFRGEIEEFCGVFSSSGQIVELNKRAPPGGHGGPRPKGARAIAKGTNEEERSSDEVH